MNVTSKRTSASLNDLRFSSSKDLTGMWCYIETTVSVVCHTKECL